MGSVQEEAEKGGIKVHTLYDVETSIPTFFHITEARVNDMNAMDAIPYEENSFYIFDRGYNDFKRLHGSSGYQSNDGCRTVSSEVAD